MVTWNEQACNEKHRSISWMFGTLITMQLMCFSWLGYLSMRVVNIETTHASTTATCTTKLDDLQQQINRRLDDVMKHLDEIKAKQK